MRVCDHVTACGTWRQNVDVTQERGRLRDCGSLWRWTYETYQAATGWWLIGRDKLITTVCFVCWSIFELLSTNRPTNIRGDVDLTGQGQPLWNINQDESAKQAIVDMMQGVANTLIDSSLGEAKQEPQLSHAVGRARRVLIKPARKINHLNLDRVIPFPTVYHTCKSMEPFRSYNYLNRASLIHSKRVLLKYCI